MNLGVWLLCGAAAWLGFSILVALFIGRLIRIGRR